MTRFFLAGIMQASRTDRFIESQDYRQQITVALQQYVPDVDIFDPFKTDPNSVHYDDQQAERTFIGNTRVASHVDVLIAYLPVASLGTAMEMWQAYEAGVTVVTVSPLVHNWAIKFTSDVLYTELPLLIEAIENGRWRDWKRDKSANLTRRQLISK